MDYCYVKNQDVLLHVHVQPGAKVTQWAGVYGEVVKIRLAAPPVDGKANDALCQFLARAFACAVRDIHVLRGQTSRQKTIAFNHAAERFALMSTQLQQYLDQS